MGVPIGKMMEVVLIRWDLKLGSGSPLGARWLFCGLSRNPPKIQKHGFTLLQLEGTDEHWDKQLYIYIFFTMICMTAETQFHLQMIDIYYSKYYPPVN